MIRYALVCSRHHEFDAWFNSSSGFDRLAEAGGVVCPVCSDTAVRKAIMAPAIGGKAPAKSEGAETTENTAAEKQGGNEGAARPLNEVNEKLVELKREIERTHEYVGNRFAEEARKIHFGEVEHRGIYGDATREQARELIDEGVRFTPLPFATRLDA